MIGRILPAQVASADAFDDSDEAKLFPEEEAIVARAVDSRRLAFATARVCARRAMAQLGIPPVAIGRIGDSAPRWPTGVVGSITHCDGYRGAAVAWAREIASVGIDAEPNAPLPPGVLRTVASADEQGRIAALAAAGRAVSWDRLLFSAKESTYKAWFPLMHEWLGFEDAQVTIDPAAGTFESHLLVPGPTVAGRRLQRFTGGWHIDGNLVATAIALPA